MTRPEFEVCSLRVATSDHLGDDTFLMAESPFRLAQKLDLHLLKLTAGMPEGSLFPRPVAISVIPIRVDLN